MNGFRLRRIPRVPLGTVFIFIFITALGALMVFPLIYLVSSAFKPLNELFLYPPRFFVQHPTLDNFRDLLLNTSQSWVPFSRYIFNSAVVSAFTVFGDVFLGSLAAYVLSKHDFPMRKAVFHMVILSIMFAPQVTQIPRFLVVQNLGMIDTYAGLIVPNLALPLGLFLMKQFIDQMPNALLEAARIDGCSEWRVFWKILMPNVKPAWATVSIFAFVAVWNDGWSPLVFTKSEAMKTLPLGLQTIGNTIAVSGAMAAATLLMILPTIIMFIILQSRVMQTMAHSGLK